MVEIFKAENVFLECRGLSIDELRKKLQILAQSKVVNLDESDQVRLVNTDQNDFLVDFLESLLKPINQCYLMLTYTLN